ncbi:MAG TPA: LptF/LptG family permease [Rickettsiales bacterium]|nr:LptF/LptG family permease [Rickettsiales bacterium]
MHRYNIYIMKQLAQAATLITLSLTSIIWLTQALRFIDFIVDRGLSFVSFLELTLMLVPSLMLFVIPFAILCAVLFVYYRLMMDSELLVLSGAGLSRFQVARPAVNVAVVATLICYLISLYLLPVSYREFKNMQSFLRDNYASLLLQEDVFNTPVDGLTVYIHDRDKNSILHGIIVHDSRDTKKPPVTMMAEEGKLQQTAQGPRFILYNGNRQEVENGKLSFLNFDQYTLDISFYASAEGARERQPEEMFLWELLYPKGAVGIEAARLVAEGNNRLSWPLFPLALTLLSMGVLLTGQFNRRGQWRRICAVIGIAVVALAASVGFLNLAVQHPWVIALMYANALVLIAVSLWNMGDHIAPGRHIMRQ